jgi:uncharacterized protein (TIGR01619 family)
MTSAYQEDWDVYFCYLEDTPAFISVDLGYYGFAPLQDKPNLIEVAIGLQTATADGFPESEEWEMLEKIEDMLVSSFDQKLEAIFVGKTLHNGTRGLYFYSGDTLLVEQMMDELREHFKDYSFEHQMQEDPSWEVYFEYLYPDEESLLKIQNNKMLRLLEEQGDQSFVPRAIQYSLRFTSEADRNAVASKVAENGFEVEEETVQKDKSEFPYKLVLTSESRADEETIYLVTEMLMQLALEHDGEFIGWETQIVREND